MTEIQALRLIIFCAPIIYYIFWKIRNDLRIHRALKNADAVDDFEDFDD